MKMVPGVRTTTLRRFRLFVLTAARPILQLVNHPACNLAEVTGWRLAEGTASANELETALDALRSAWEEAWEASRPHYYTPPEIQTLLRLVNILTLLLLEPDECFNEPTGAARHLITPLDMGIVSETQLPLLTPEQTNNCCWLFREIFGDRGVVLLVDDDCKPSWITSNAQTLANLIYADNAFNLMPILADALEEAGCDNREILFHCREPGPHVRGCWVVDLVRSTPLPV